MKKILLVMTISTQIVHSKKDETPALDLIEAQRIIDAQIILQRDVAFQQAINAAHARRQQENQQEALQQQVAEQQRIEEAQRNQNQNRVQALLHRRVQAAGDIRRNGHRAGPMRNRRRGQGNLPRRNLMPAFNQPNNNLNEEFQVVEVGPDVQVVPVNNRPALNQIAINAQNRLIPAGNGVFVIQNNIAAEEVAPIANIPVVLEYQEPQGFPAEYNIN